MSDLLLICYHAISDAWESPLAVRPEHLEEHVDSLRRRGFTGVTLTEAVRGPATARAVAITFDDAYRSVFELGLPILSAAGFPASIYVPTAFVGRDEPASWPGIDQWLVTDHRDELIPMSWQQLGTLCDAGWEVGSHTRSHPRLTELGQVDLEAELSESRAEVEARLSRPCRSLTYPYGAYDDRVIAATRQAGYSAAAGTLPGRLRPATGRFDWPRIVINHSDSRRRFNAKTARLTRRVKASPGWDGVTAVRRAARRRRPEAGAGTHNADDEARGPVIIVGTGRCGSTMLHRLLARHEDLGWLSTFNEALPPQPWVSAFSAAYELPLPARLKDLKVFPKPFEAYRFWEHYLPGFSRRDRPQRAEDVPASGIGPVRRATYRVLRYQRRKRLLVKVTGWARIAYFDRIYPDARFISLHRDARSVVSSWLKAGWLDVTSSPESAGWQWGEVPAAYLHAWGQLGGDPLLSAALKIRLDLDDIAANMALVPARCREIRYEDVITKPEPTLRELCDFAGLSWNQPFADTVRATRFYDSTGKWRDHLSDADGERILEFMRRTGRSEDQAGTPAT